MQYRKLPKGSEQISVLGIGTSSVQASGEKEIEKIMDAAIESGINFFDMASAEAKPFAAYGRAINKYYDLARSGDELARNHYENLAVKAETCIRCGHCNSRCPFHVDQVARMHEIADYFKC